MKIPWIKYNDECPCETLLAVAWIAPDEDEYRFEFAYRGEKTKMIISIPDGVCLEEIGTVDSYVVWTDPEGLTRSLS